MAVYTHITETEAKNFCRTVYDLPEVIACRPLQEGTDNSNYHLTTKTGDFVLTLFEGRINPENLPVIFEFAGKIGDAVISTPRLQKTRDGAVLGYLKDKPATIVSFLKGRSIEPPGTEQALHMARILAKMHVFAETDSSALPDNMYSLPKLTAMFEQCSDNIQRFDASLMPEIADLLAKLTQNLPAAGDLPEGPLHGDLFPDNVFFDQGQLSGVIDFYMACRDWLIYDLAITINAWCFDAKGQIQPARFRRFLDQYQNIRPLNAAERATFALVGQWAALRIALTRLRDYYPARDDIVFTPRDPRPYMNIVHFYTTFKLDEYL